MASSNPLVVTGICDLNKSRARHHRSWKLGLKSNYLNNEESDEGYFLEVDDQFSKKLHEQIHNRLLFLPEKK